MEKKRYHDSSLLWTEENTLDLFAQQGLALEVDVAIQYTFSVKLKLKSDGVQKK